MSNVWIERAIAAACTAILAVAVLTSCVQSPPTNQERLEQQAVAGNVVTDTGPPLVWYMIDARSSLETACTPWRERLYRIPSGTNGGYSITAVPDGTGSCGTQLREDSPWFYGGPGGTRR